MKTKTLILFTIFHITVLSQNNNNLKTPTIIHMAPDAYSLFKYSEIPVSLSTGVPNISIPIYTIKLKNIELPILIDYHSSGIKTDEIATDVGLGWTLKAGGMVSNQVFGQDDFFSSLGYASAISNLPFDRALNPTSPNTTACAVNNDAEYEILKNMINGGWDTEPDIFYYNCGNLNGKFYFSKDNQNNLTANNIPFRPIKINRLTGKYEIIDENGNMFIYSTIGETHSYSNIFTDFGKTRFNWCNDDYTEVLDFGTQSSNNISYSYYISEIRNIYGDRIFFEYENEFYKYNLKDEYVRYKSTNNYLIGQPFPQNIENKMETIIVVLGKRIKKIYSTAGDEINFSYSTNVRLDLPKDNYALGINQMTGANSLECIKIKKGNSFEKYEFRYGYFNLENNNNFNFNINNIDYSRYIYRLKLESIIKDSIYNFNFTYYNENSLKNRLSYNYDHFGYQNDSHKKYPLDYRYNFTDGADRTPNLNSTLNGTLKSIQYPTGGKTEFEFELNSFYGTIYNYTPSEVFNKSLIITGYEGENPPNYNPTELIDSIVISNNVIPSSVTLTTYNPATSIQQTANEIISMSIRNIENNQFIDFDYPIGSSTNSINLSPGNYEVKIYSNMEGAGIYIQWMNEPLNNELTGNHITGGLRVAKIKNYDNDNTLKTIKNYSYTNSDNSKSSGIMLKQPQYSYLYTKRATWCHECQAIVNFLDNTYYVQKSSNIQPLNGMQGYHLMYDNIKEYLGNNSNNFGFTESTFSYSPDIDPEILRFPPTQSTSLDFLRGNLIEKKEFIFNQQTNSYKLLKKTVNNYTYNYNENIISDIFSMPNKLNEKHALGLTLELFNTEKICTSSGPINCSRLSIGCNLNYYKLISPWVYLNKTTEEVFDNNNSSIVTETIYKYENPTHSQITNKSIVNSNGKSLIEKYKYPHDLLNENIMNAEMSELIIQNRIFEPLHMSSFVKENSNETNIQESFTKYEKNNYTGNILLPTIQYQKYGNSSIFPLNEKDAKLWFKKYGTNSNGIGNGNLLEYKSISNTNNVYLWSYNNQYPVAEIKNATYSEVVGALSGITPEQLGSASEPDMAKVEALRHHPGLLKAQVTTYTYKPLVGILTATDPRGVTTHYEYDTLNRLMQTYIIENGEKKILQKYDYHYANQ